MLVFVIRHHSVDTWKGVMAVDTKKARTILTRSLAVFLASGLSVVGAGAVVGVDLWKSVLIAGFAGVAAVARGLSRAYLRDGDLTTDEIDAVFSEVDAETDVQ